MDGWNSGWTEMRYELPGLKGDRIAIIRRIIVLTNANCADYVTLNRRETSDIGPTSPCRPITVMRQLNLFCQDGIHSF